MSPEHFDVLIVGAGISGIGAAYHLQTRCPGRSYAILEGRECLGGRARTASTAGSATGTA